MEDIPEGDDGLDAPPPGSPPWSAAADRVEELVRASETLALSERRSGQDCCAC